MNQYCSNLIMLRKISKKKKIKNDNITIKTSMDINTYLSKNNGE